MVMSSVAGDRGRASNYIYGSAKAGINNYLSGLRSKLASKNIHVLTIKPGYLNTKMTKGLSMPKILTSEPDDVAMDIFYAYKAKKDVVYIKSIWRWIMLFMNMIPENLFKRINI